VGKHVVDIDPLNAKSIERAEREYRRLAKQFDKKVDIFLKRLADLGRDTLNGLGYTGGKVTVSVSPITNGYCIELAGQGVVFLEFGAGDTVESGNRYASRMPFEVRSGSYSETHAREYSETGRWYFGGVWYTEIMPRNGMQTVWENIMQEWRRIAQEVFR